MFAHPTPTLLPHSPKKQAMEITFVNISEQFPENKKTSANEKRKSHSKERPKWQQLAYWSPTAKKDRTKRTQIKTRFL